jgi:hypothetical protein
MNPVAPYTGQNQEQHINVPATIAYRYEWEEGPWEMPPYASIYPTAIEAELALVPPPVYLTDIWSAMQTWPMPQAG